MGKGVLEAENEEEVRAELENALYANLKGLGVIL